MGRVTMRDVAERAGVSKATVSHVLNGTRFVEPDTRSRVEQVIAALGYRPNLLARGLRRHETLTIGLITPNIANPFWAEFASEVEQERAGVVVQVGYMRRYAPAFVEACRLLPELGPMRLARVHDVLGWNALFVKDTSAVVRGDDVPTELLAEGKARRERLLDEALGDAPAILRGVYGLLLGLSSHDLSAIRELLGMPKRVLHAAQRQGGLYLTAAFDYGAYICQFETGINNLPRFDAHLEVYGKQQVLRVQYDTPYVRNLLIRLHITEANGQGGVASIRPGAMPLWPSGAPSTPM
jgi:transcriptional regulator with XRE-family HTH domain